MQRHHSFESLPRLACSRLSQENPPHELENQNSGMEKAAAGSADGSSAGTRPDTGLAKHGLRKGARGFKLAEGATRPGEATRHIDTAASNLNYRTFHRGFAAGDAQAV